MSENVEIVERPTSGGREVSVQSPQPPGGMVTLFGTDDPQIVVQRATATSKALMAVVQSQDLSVPMGQDKDFLKVEAWTLLGSMVGVFATPIWTRPVKDGNRTIGWEARVEARTLGGALVGGAESMCTRDETTTKRNGDKIQRWADADEHALRSMAQTRATSKALAMPLRFIAVLAGYAGTPYEEMPARERGQSASNLPPARTNGGSDGTAKPPVCPKCEMAQYKTRNGGVPRIYPSRKAGKPDQCNGVDAEGDCQNHTLDVPAPVAAAPAQLFDDGSPIPDAP